MPVSSAEPQTLWDFADATVLHEHELRGPIARLDTALDGLRGSGSWGLPTIPDLGAEVRTHVYAASGLGTRAQGVGDAFWAADAMGGLLRLLGFEIVPGGVDDRVIQELLGPILAELSKQEWQRRAYEAAGIDPTAWDPSLGLAYNDATVQRVYAYYANLYLEHPELQWAGMAALAGGSFYAGWQDLYVVAGITDEVERASRIRSMLRLPGGLPGAVVDEIVAGVADLTGDELRWFLSKFLTMQREIFDDLAWQHEAYRQGGIDEIRRLNEIGAIGDDLLQAWEDIASGDPARVDAGNQALLVREQRDIIQDDYDAMRAHHGIVGEAFTRIMTWVAPAPIPGGRPYRDVVTHDIFVGVDTPDEIPIPFTPWGIDTPDEVGVHIEIPRGTLAKFNDRWEWIETDMLPAWEALVHDDPERARQLVGTPVAERADDFRLVPLPYDP